MIHLFIDHDGERWFWWHGEKRSDILKCNYAHTDNHGRGIWVWNRRTCEDTQIVGTCDFSVRMVKDPRGKIRRWDSK